MTDSLKLFYQAVHEQILLSVRRSGSDILFEMSEYHFLEPGKMLRPRLVYALGTILGVAPQILVKWAAAVEMLHNATLIHDDLQDGDKFRRGRLTVWQKYGALQAINLGDFLMLLAPSLFLESDLDSTKKFHLSLLYSRMATEIVNGQSVEPSLKKISAAEEIESAYMNCISQKTSALFAGVAEGVALLADLEPRDQASMARIFREIGDLFQIQDDVLDLYGNKKRDQAGSDIKEGKVSYMVVQHLKNVPEDQRSIFEVLSKSRESTTDDEVQSLIKDFRQKGTLDLALREIEQKRKNIFASSLPSIRSFVESFVDEVLSPVEHLFSDSRGPE